MPTLLQMCEKWKNEVLDSSAQTIFVNKWLAKTTLDIIGGGEFISSCHVSILIQDSLFSCI